MFLHVSFTSTTNSDVLNKDEAFKGENVNTYVAQNVNSKHLFNGLQVEGLNVNYTFIFIEFYISHKYLCVVMESKEALPWIYSKVFIQMWIEIEVNIVL